jgi:hypothetical protein
LLLVVTEWNVPGGSGRSACTSVSIASLMGLKKTISIVCSMYMAATFWHQEILDGIKDKYACIMLLLYFLQKL